MQTWTHQGITISFNTVTAKFYAPAGGKTIYAPSLDALKKQIDKALDRSANFTPFDAVEVGDRGTGIEEVKVIGLGKVDQRHSWKGKYEFRIQEGHNVRGRGTAIPATAANLKVVKAFEEMCKKNRSEIARLESEINRAREKLPYVKAEDVAMGKVTP